MFTPLRFQRFRGRPDQQPRDSDPPLVVGSIMHRGVAVVEPDDSVRWAAERMRDWNVGALPVCDSDGRAMGMITDRDIAVLAVANGFDPVTTTVGELSRHPVHTVDIDTELRDALATMTRYRIRRLPVTEGGKLVGMISEGDIARHLAAATVGSFLKGLYAP